MADSDQFVSSSSSPFFTDEVHHYQAEPEPEQHRPDKDLFSMDDIVDLVGGAQDALERHIAEDESTEVPFTHAEESVKFTEPEPVTVLEPEPEPEPEPVPVSEVETLLPDSSSSSIVHDTPLIEPEVIAPKAEPESTITTSSSSTILPPPLEPEPEPESRALPALQPRKAAPSPAEAAQQPAVTEEAPAPASCLLLHRWNINVDSRVVDLLYWRDVKTTGVVFGAILLLLLSLTVCSIVSVCSYIGLALLSVTICFRIYKGILQAIQKSDEGHPFKQYLDHEVALSEDMVHKYSDIVLARLNKTIGELRRLFLVEDLVDSIKFAVLMWILTYVGALFNGLTIVILTVVGVFSCPIVYEKHQAQIDHYVALVNNQVKDVVGKIQAKVPGMKRKTE